MCAVRITVRYLTQRWAPGYRSRKLLEINVRHRVAIDIGRIFADLDAPSAGKPFTVSVDGECGEGVHGGGVHG